MIIKTLSITRTLYFVGICLMIGMTIYLTVILLNGFNKGFECSDESYYNVVSNDAMNKHAFASSYGLVNESFTHSGAGWISLRMYKWVFQLISLLVFCYSLANYASRKMEMEGRRIWLLILPVFISGWVNYDYLPSGLSYNSWSFICTLLFCSAFLIEATAKKQRQAVVAGILHGFVFMILLSVKLPNAMFVLLFYFIYKIFIWRRYVASSLLAFILTSFLMCPLIYGNFVNALQAIADVLTEINGVKHTDLSVYLEQFKDFLQNGPGFIFLGIQLTVLVLVFFLPLFTVRPIVYLTILYNFVFLFTKRGGNSFLIYNDFTYFLVFLLSALLVFYAEKRFSDTPRSRPSIKFLILTFLLLPFLMAAGTNNSIFYTASQFGTLYVAAAGLFLAPILQQQAEIVIALSAVFFSVLIMFAVRQGYQETPYRQTELKEKNMPLIFSDSFKSVLESRERFVFFAELSARIKKCNPMKFPVSSSFSYVGASLLCDLPVLKCFWLPDPGYGLEKVRQHFQFCRFPSGNKMLIFSQKELNFPGYKNELTSAGMNTERDFDKCDSVYCKYNQEFVYLYLSKAAK